MSLNTDDNGAELISSEVKGDLKSLVRDLGITDYTVSFSKGSIRGDNLVGIITKATIQGYDTKSKQNVRLNLIIKCAPREGLFRNFAPLRDVYQREIYIYKEVLPRFAQLQEEHGVVQNRFVSYAHFYKSSMENLNEMLIMEDVKSLGFVMLDRRNPLNYENARLVMREFGRLHALSFALREYTPTVFEELTSNLLEIVITFWRNNPEVRNESVNARNKRALNAFDPIKDAVVINRFKTFCDNALDYLYPLMNVEAAGKYAVIGHGDSWINNMLFKYADLDAPHKPTHLCLLDWQLARIGSPALDLSYFLCTCTDKKLRDEHYDDLLKEYHDSLSKLLIELGCDPTKLFPFEALQQQLKKFSAFGLYMSIMVLYFMLSETEEIPDIHKNDYEKGEEFEKFNFQTKNIGEYYTRLRDVVLDFVKFDYDF